MTSDPVEPGPTDVTTVVRGLWVEVLGHDDFADDESFFDVGGHSLRGVLLMRRLEESLGATLPVALLFDHQSVTALAAAVRGVPRRPRLETSDHGR